ncbi:MAG: YeeE/YedE thiosulfate transporter family protein [Candidatus Methylomirabilia bacterium]
MSLREDRGWNPYVAGGLSGVLIVLSAYFTSNYFGASSSFVRTAGILEKFVGPEHVARTSYLLRYAPRIDWQWFFLVGVCLGALVAALLTRDFAWRGMPPMWAERFGSSAPLRAVAAFAGGFILLVGARIAGG